MEPFKKPNQTGQLGKKKKTHKTHTDTTNFLCISILLTTSQNS